MKREPEKEAATGINRKRQKSGIEKGEKKKLKIQIELKRTKRKRKIQTLWVPKAASRSAFISQQRRYEGIINKRCREVD